MLISIENVVLWNEDVKSKFQKVILFFKKLADIKSNLTLPPTTIRPGVTLGIKDYQGRIYKWEFIEKRSLEYDRLFEAKELEKLKVPRSPMAQYLATIHTCQKVSV